MKNDLTCGVVEDLLPAYLERLTCSETDEAVRRHLAACRICARRAEAMSRPDPAVAADREVDYLKKVKKNHGKRVLLAVFCTVLVLVLSLAAKVFVIGSEPQYLFVANSELTETGALRLHISTTTSADAHWGWRVTTRDGVAVITARQVLVSPLFPYGGGTVEVPLEGVERIELCGRTVWEEGLTISPRVQQLLEARSPYTGDAPALEDLVNLLNLGNAIGGYQMTLDTAQPPYGCGLDFGDPLTADQDRIMTGGGYLLLALVDNLEVVRWESGSGPGALTLADADDALAAMTADYNAAHGTNWPVPVSVKDCAASPAALQRLVLTVAHRYGLALQ